ncbi:MAG TPA: ABC transporter ATP-binding protein, partial [Thermomicrobiales bacterium]|nr:ABC transporter ATP-binding protein [Thermomicrobiales bacterium]
SAVDVATEARIQQALATERQTRLIVAQRVSAVINADRILILDNGDLVAEGTHRELLATSPVYRDIHASQMEGEGEYDGAA